MPMAFLTPAGPEWLVLAVMALLVLGPKRLPDAARSLGKGLAEMRESFSSATSLDSDDEEDPDEDLPPYPDDEDLDSDEPEIIAAKGEAEQPEQPAKPAAS
jgi:TatA/E family protein of Tat protein translocase